MGVGCESRDMERVGDEGRRREKHRAMGVGAECENDVERRVWGALAARGGMLDCWSLVEVWAMGCVCCDRKGAPGLLREEGACGGVRARGFLYRAALNPSLPRRFE